MEFHKRQQYPLVLMSLIMLGAGLFKQIYAAEIGYVYAGGERIARSVDNTQLQSYVADNKGSVLNLVDGVAPVTGVAYQYDAYGLALKSPAMNIPNPFQYNGEWTDNFSQLQYLRARFYNSKLMRFVQQDSYDLVNRFNYGDGNPIVNSDPSGHFSVIPNVLNAGGGLGFDAVTYLMFRGNGYMIFSAGFINIVGQITDIALLSGGVIKQKGDVDRIIAFGSFVGGMALAIGSVYVSLRSGRLLYDNPRREIRQVVEENADQVFPVGGVWRGWRRNVVQVEGNELINGVRDLPGGGVPVGNEILENTLRKTQKFKQAIQEAKVEEVEMTRFLAKYEREDPITKENFEVNQLILGHKAPSGEDMLHPMSYSDNNQAFVQSLAKNGCPQCRAAYTDKNIQLYRLIGPY